VWVFFSKVFIDEKWTIADGLVQRTLLAGGIKKNTRNSGVLPRAQNTTNVENVLLTE
jgi:hypothetical protein